MPSVPTRIADAFLREETVRESFLLFARRKRSDTRFTTTTTAYSNFVARKLPARGFAEIKLSRYRLAPSRSLRSRLRGNEMISRPISTRVNSPRNNDPGIVERIV
jgi:hypothetical protein